MQRDIRVQSKLGKQAKEFGRDSEVTSPVPTEQDLSQVSIDFTKYDLLFIPNNIAIRCIGCMEYIWEHEYTPGKDSDTSLINDFTVASLLEKIIDHRLECTYWNK
jgi:hypothetical protein